MRFDSIILLLFSRAKSWSEISFPELLHLISSHDVDHFISRSTTAVDSSPLGHIHCLQKTRNRGVFVFFKTALSKSRGQDFFLKGGSVVTPQNFNLVLLIKNFPRN